MDNTWPIDKIAAWVEDSQDAAKLLAAVPLDTLLTVAVNRLLGTESIVQLVNRIRAAVPGSGLLEAKNAVHLLDGIVDHIKALQAQETPQEPPSEPAMRLYRVSWVTYPAQYSWGVGGKLDIFAANDEQAGQLAKRYLTRPGGDQEGTHPRNILIQHIERLPEE